MQKNTIAGLAALFLAGGAFAQVPESLFGGMRYRPIGPSIFLHGNAYLGARETVSTRSNLP